MNDASAVIASFGARHRDGATLAILLDFDGTLAPIVEHPAMAMLDPRRRALLGDLAVTPRVVVGVISGRTLSDLEERVGLRGIYYAGTGGMELDLLGTRLKHPDEDACTALIATVAARLQGIAATWPGAWIEQKRVGITIHYRAVRASDRATFLHEVDRWLEPWMTQLRLLGGPLAIEVMPRAGWNKGSAVEIILNHIGGHRVAPLYAGDEANDGHAFDTVNAAGGIAIGIGPQAPVTAGCRLADPDALSDLLERLCAALPRSAAPRVNASSTSHP